MKELYIRFMAPVIPQSADLLFKAVDYALKNKYERINLLLSSPGGSVFHGLSLYNYLKGIPLEVYTSNFGSVDSIGVVIFCAGKKRFSVPHARFLLHGVRFNFNGAAALDEKQLEENLKGLKIDSYNIAKVVADNTGRAVGEVEKDMHNRTTLSSEEAKAYGLIQDINSILLPIDAELITIGENPAQNQIQPVGNSNPFL
jgi:ATP-dependent Clp endopeptidase proteolytic subunit ClpP